MKNERGDFTQRDTTPTIEKKEGVRSTSSLPNCADEGLLQKLNQALGSGARGVAVLATLESITSHAEATELSPIERIDLLHHRASEELRNDPILLAEFRPEQLSAAAEALEMFDAQSMFRIASRESGIPEDELAARFGTSRIVVFTERSLAATPGDIYPVPDQKLIGYPGTNAKDHPGAYDSNTRTIYLNLEMIISMGGEDEITSRMLDVLYHETVHSFDHSYINIVDYELYEGKAETLANIFLEEIHHEQKFVNGYSGGIHAAAALMYEALPPGDRSAYWRSTIQNDSLSLQTAYDKQFGAGSYLDLLSLELGLTFDTSIANEHVHDVKRHASKLHSVTVLDRILADVNYDSQIIARTNARLEEEALHLVVTENVKGAILVTKPRNSFLTKIAGILHAKNASGKESLLVPEASGTNEISAIPGTNLSVLHVNLTSLNSAALSEFFNGQYEQTQ